MLCACLAKLPWKTFLAAKLHCIISLKTDMSKMAASLYFQTFYFLHSQLWKTTVELPRGEPVQYRYFKGYFLEPKVCTTFSMLSWVISNKKHPYV